MTLDHESDFCFDCRLDGKDLVKDWLKSKDFKGVASYAWHRHQIIGNRTEGLDYLLGELSYMELSAYFFTKYLAFEFIGTI